MPTSRRRRIVRRTVMALAIVVLLVSYVGLWVVEEWDDDAAPSPREWATMPYWLFSPLELYASGRLPGSDQLFTLHEWAQAGGGSWEECRVAMRYNKYGIDSHSH